MELFFLNGSLLTVFLFEGNQHHLLEYHAAGTVTKADSRQTTLLEGYAEVLAQNRSTPRNRPKACLPNSVSTICLFSILSGTTLPREWERAAVYHLLVSRDSKSGMSQQYHRCRSFLWKAMTRPRHGFPGVGLEREEGYAVPRTMLRPTSPKRISFQATWEMLKKQLSSLDPNASPPD